MGSGDSMYKEYIVARNRSNYKRLPGDEGENHINNCKFCKILKDKKEVVLETKDMFVMINQNPYNTGHVMVLPKRHIKDPRELAGGELKNFYGVANKMMTVIEKTYPLHGFNMGINLNPVAGATFEHLHIHVVPRWQGDVGFMESTIDTKILKGDAPKDTLEKLRETISREKISFD